MNGFAFGQTYPPIWSAVVGALAITGLMIALYAVVRHPVRWFILTLRLAVWGLLLLVVFRVSAVHYQIETERKPLAVVVDRSESMMLPIGEKRTRWDEVKTLLNQDGFWSRIDKNFDLRFFSLAEGLNPSNREALRNAPSPTGENTHLLSAISRLGDDPSWGGILLMTDGVDTSATALESVWKSTVPIVALHSSPPKQMVDAAIVAVRSPEIAYFKSSINIEVDVEAEGVAFETIRVRLLDGERLLAEGREPTGGWHGHRGTFSLSFAPDRIGPMGLRLEIPRFPEELTYDNNLGLAAVQVLRDRIRVLHVAGKPNWDERFLRAYLKENPNLDLISFYILRSPVNEPEAPENALSLIPFPYHELFTKELENFDLVIFQNFDFRTYFAEFYLANIQSYVEKGGAFLFIGGDLSFGRGNYKGTPVENILPVVLRDDSQEISSTPFSPQLSRDGARHPILARTWSNETLRTFPLLWGFHRTGGLQPNAVTLLEHPTEKRMPILAVRGVGQGRTAAMMVDSLWRWNFGERSVAYRELFNRVYRWLTRDPSSNPLQLELPREVRVGDPLPLRVRLLDERYAPLTGGKVKLDLLQGSLTEPTPSLPPTDSSGVTSSSTLSSVPGFVEYEASVPGKEEGGYRSRAMTLVTPKNREWIRRGVDVELLSAVAVASEGEIRPITQADPSMLAPFTKKLKTRKIGEVEDPMWDRSWTLLAILTLATVEWFLRRRFGGA